MGSYSVTQVTLNSLIFLPSPPKYWSLFWEFESVEVEVLEVWSNYITAIFKEHVTCELKTAYCQTSLGQKLSVSLNHLFQQEFYMILMSTDIKENWLRKCAHTGRIKRVTLRGDTGEVFFVIYFAGRHKNCINEAQWSEMAQWLRALVVLSENQVSTPSTHVAVDNHLSFSSRGYGTCFVLWGHYTYDIPMYIQTKYHAHKIKVKNKLCWWLLLCL